MWRCLRKNCIDMFGHVKFFVQRIEEKGSPRFLRCNWGLASLVDSDEENQKWALRVSGGVGALNEISWQSFWASENLTAIKSVEV